MRRYLLAVVCLLLVACPGDLNRALREYGYVPVRPASSLWRPGSIVWVQHRNPLQVGFVCTASQVMGADYAPLQSTTTNADLARASKKGITMGARLQDIASADGEFTDVKSVSVLVRNVREFACTDLDVAQAATKLSKRCLQAIARRRAQGYDVTFISGAIEADVSFSVRFHKSSKLDAQAKIAAAQNISAKLGVDASSVTDKTIEAQQLVWGVRADDFLAKVLAPDILPAADRGSRIFNPADIEQVEAFAVGTEPRSMPTTPMNEQQPMIWAPLPAFPGTKPPVVDSTELAAAVSGDASQVAVQPPKVSVVPVDTPHDPAESPPPEAGQEADVDAMTDAEWEAYLIEQGFDPNETVTVPAQTSAG